MWADAVATRTSADSVEKSILAICVCKVAVKSPRLYYSNGEPFLLYTWKPSSANIRFLLPPTFRLVVCLSEWLLSPPGDI